MKFFFFYWMIMKHVHVLVYVRYFRESECYHRNVLCEAVQVAWVMKLLKCQ